MSSKSRIANSYAKFFFKNSVHFLQTAKKAELGTVIAKKKRKKVYPSDIFYIGAELQLFRAVLISSPKLVSILLDPSIESKEKIKIFLGFFPNVSKITKAFLMLLNDEAQLLLIPQISDEFTQILFHFQETKKIELMVATSLTKKGGKSILERLKRATKIAKIILTVTYSLKFGDGFCLKYNSVIMDETLLRKLTRLLSTN